jgi:hypothetical protein
VRRRLAALALGVAVGVAVAEGLARARGAVAGEEFLAGAPDPQRFAYLEGAPGPGSGGTGQAAAPRPGWSGTLRLPGRSVLLRFDANGVRGETGSAPRWLALGDSFTLAAQVDEAETFCALLGARVGRSVVNGGVDAYSTTDSIRRYRSLAATIMPERVLLVFFLGNDLSDNARPVPLAAPEVQGRPSGPSAPAPHAPPAANPLRLALDRHSAAWAWANVALRRAQLLRDGPDDGWRREFEIFTTGGATRLSEQLPHTRRALADLRDETRRRGHALTVAVAPPSFVADPTQAEDFFRLLGVAPRELALDAPGTAVRGVLGELGIDACDLTPALRGHPQAFLAYDGHWSADGHRRVAAALAACVE